MGGGGGRIPDVRKVHKVEEDHAPRHEASSLVEPASPVTTLARARRPQLRAHFCSKGDVDEGPCDDAGPTVVEQLGVQRVLQRVSSECTWQLGAGQLIRKRHGDIEGQTALSRRSLT